MPSALIHDQPVAGINPYRQASFNPGLPTDAARALLLDARLAIESGDIPRTLESVRAANGLSTHFMDIESPSLMGTLIGRAIQQQIQQDASANLLPAPPQSQPDPVVWQNAIDPQVGPPSELGRMIKAEWNVTAQNDLFPILSDAEEPNSPIDPDLVIDRHASFAADLIRASNLPATSDWANLSLGDMPASSRLSREGAHSSMPSPSVRTIGSRRVVHQLRIDESSLVE